MDHFDKDFQELIAKGKSQGFLTYDEVTNYEAFQNPQQFYWRKPDPHALSPEEREALIPSSELTPAAETG